MCVNIYIYIFAFLDTHHEETCIAFQNRTQDAVSRRVHLATNTHGVFLFNSILPQCILKIAPYVGLVAL